MSDEERKIADEAFPVWLAVTYPGETDLSPDVLAERRREYQAELDRLMAVEV